MQPQLLDVSGVLAARAGEVVSRDTLLEAVWHGKVVTEESLTRAISELRKALGDKANTPSYIQTIPKKGYRLLCNPAPVSFQSFRKIRVSPKLACVFFEICCT